MPEVRYWKGQPNREIQVRRPCPCGCDLRDGPKGVGYLTGSDDAGNGFTCWFHTESEFQAALQNPKAAYLKHVAQ